MNDIGDQILIVGTGLLGGSVGLALRESGFRGRIMGLGRDPSVLSTAKQRGCIDEAVDTCDLATVISRTRLVVIATPLSAFSQVLKLIVPYDHEGLVITDVGSTKQWVCRQASQILPQPDRFVGSHPMAGGERHGPEHSRADLFRDKPCILVELQDATPQAVTIVEELWTRLGMRLIRMSAQEHDQAVARVSHVPHLAAVLLVELASQGNGLDIASSGFADTTRVASGDPQIWLDIFKTNREAVIEVVSQFERQIKQFSHDLISGGDCDDRIMELLMNSKTLRDQWAKTFSDRRRSTGGD